MKRRFLLRCAAVISVTVALLGLTTLFILWCGREYACVSIGKTYYFLARDCEEATAASVTAQVYLSGGAGYLLEKDGESSVVLACYYKQTSADAVCRNMIQRGVDTRVLAYDTTDFGLEGSDAAYAQKIVQNAGTVDTNARILFDVANGLERSEISQEEARTAVRGVVSSLGGLRTGNDAEIFGYWNNFLYSAERRGRELAEGILFAKDLRYLQVTLCFGILNAENYFV